MDEVEIRFLGRGAVSDVAKATGAFRTAMQVPACTFSVGDIVQSPTAPTLFFEVKQRIFRPVHAGEPALWALVVEPVPDPFAEID